MSPSVRHVLVFSVMDRSSVQVSGKRHGELILDDLHVVTQYLAPLLTYKCLSDTGNPLWH